MKVTRIKILTGPMLVAILLLTLHASTQAQSTPSQRQIKINEFMAANDSVLENPEAPGRFPDWLELYNPTNAAVSLDGLVFINGDLSDPVRFPIADGLSIPANGFVIFYCDDNEEQGVFHTNFRLDENGDRIGLYRDLDGTDEIDVRLFGQQTTDYSEGREPDGGPTWRQYSRPTPGYTNILQSPLIRDIAHTPELPTSSESVQVTATISDDGIIIEASLVYSITGVPAASAPMILIEGTTWRGEIPPQPSGAIVDYYVTARDDEGMVSPNQAIARLRYYRYPVDYIIPTLVVNEVMADNDDVLEDPDDAGDYQDWVEIYNYGPQTVSLDGLYLTDNLDNPTQFAISDGLSLLPGRFQLFYADEQTEQGPHHLNFRLDVGGESVAIYGAEGIVRIDQLTYPRLFENQSYGRIPDGAEGEQTLLYCASPGSANINCERVNFLPMVSRNAYVPPFPVLMNGNFDDSSHDGWRQNPGSDDEEHDLIVNADGINNVSALSPPNVAWLGGTASVTDELLQQVFLPDYYSDIRIRFRYFTRSRESSSSCGNDQFQLYLVHTDSGQIEPLHQLDLCDLADWHPVPVVAPINARGDVEIRFTAINDGENQSNIFLDDVKLCDGSSQHPCE